MKNTIEIKNKEIIKYIRKTTNNRFIIPAFLYLYNNEGKKSTREIWDNVKIEIEKFSKAKTPRGSLSVDMEMFSENSTSKYKKKDPLFHKFIEKPLKYGILSIHRKNIESIIKTEKAEEIEAKKIVYILGEKNENGNGNSYFIKIGKTTNTNKNKRPKELQTGNPRELYVITSIEGGYEFEKFLQKIIFKNYYTRGEWFKITRDNVLELFILAAKHLFDVIKQQEKIIKDFK